MTTPNMTLILPVPGPAGTVGPTWASDLNTALELVDAHDHTSGNGVQVPSAGININGDLPMNENNLTEARTVRFEDQAASLTAGADIRIIYSKNGELVYRDGSGNEVQITNGGSVAGATGTITGMAAPASASYSTISKSYTFNQGTSKPGKLNISDIGLVEFDNATAQPVTLKSPAALAAAYSLTMPGDLPLTTQHMTVSPTGEIDHRSLLGESGEIVLTENADDTTISIDPSFSPTTISLASGAFNDPSLGFLTSDAGLYQISPTSMGVTANGFTQAVFDEDGVRAVHGITSGENGNHIKWETFEIVRTGVNSVESYNIDVPGNIIGVNGFVLWGGESSGGGIPVTGRHVLDSEWDNATEGPSVRHPAYISQDGGSSSTNHLTNPGRVRIKLNPTTPGYDTYNFTVRGVVFYID